MKLLTKDIRDRLLANGHKSETAMQHDGDSDHCPVVKLFTPDANATWLLTELDPHDHDIAFGLCDLGLGSPELGRVSISEIEAVRGRYGLPVERDRHFTAKGPISEYADKARAKQRICA